MNALRMGLPGGRWACEHGVDHWPGPLLPGISLGMNRSPGLLSERGESVLTIQILFPFNNVWFSLVVFFP